jgi:N6-adenosine-specific RNA methylase IME4
LKKNAYDGWTCKVNAWKQTSTENFRMGTRGNAKKGKTQREVDRWSKTNHGLTEEDTRDRDRWRNLVLGEGKPL